MKGKIPALTGIRGVAASWVVLLHYHALLTHLGLWSAWLPSRIVLAGYLAVDLFFILSGFVLALSYVERMQSVAALDGLTSFFLNRVFRILPLNTVCLFTMLAMVLAVGGRYWTSFPLDFPSFLAALLLVQAWGVGSATTWNLPAWSLSAEWLAYAAFPVIVVMAARIPSRGLAAVAWLACLSLLAALMIRLGDASLDHTWLLGLPRCLLQFAAGMMLWRWLRLGAVTPRAADRFLAIGLIGLCVAIYAPHLQLIAPIAFSALIVACAGRGRWTERLLGGRCIEWVGEISFSLYLTHFILLGLFVYIATVLSIADANVGVRTAFALTALASVYLMSWVTWRFVEIPGQRLGRRLTAGATAPGSGRTPEHRGDGLAAADRRRSAD